MSLFLQNCILEPISSRTNSPQYPNFWGWLSSDVIFHNLKMAVLNMAGCRFERPHRFISWQAMVRGHAKQQAQEKNASKQAAHLFFFLKFDGILLTGGFSSQKIGAQKTLSAFLSWKILVVFIFGISQSKVRFFVVSGIHEEGWLTAGCPGRTERDLLAMGFAMGFGVHQGPKSRLEVPMPLLLGCLFEVTACSSQLRIWLWWFWKRQRSAGEHELQDAPWTVDVWWVSCFLWVKAEGAASGSRLLGAFEIHRRRIQVLVAIST